MYWHQRIYMLAIHSNYNQIRCFYVFPMLKTCLAQTVGWMLLISDQIAHHIAPAFMHMYIYSTYPTQRPLDQAIILPYHVEQFFACISCILLTNRKPYWFYYYLSSGVAAARLQLKKNQDDSKRFVHWTLKKSSLPSCWKKRALIQRKGYVDDDDDDTHIA